MKLSLSLVIGACGAFGTMAIIAACANDDNTAPPTETPDAQSFPDVSVGVDSANAADASSEAAPPIDCTMTAFCNSNAPVPGFVAVNGIWGSSATDIWVVGSHSTILHGDGTTFAPSVPAGDAGVGDDSFLFSVWGAGKDDVWIGLADAPRHYAATTDGGAPTWQTVQGTTWAPGNALRIAAIWGSSSTNVWLAGLPSSSFGNGGSFWVSAATRGGVAWTETDAFQGQGSAFPFIHSLWGTDANNIFAVGDFGAAFRFVPAAGRTPASWQQLDSYTTVPLDGVWGSSATDVWAVGAEGTLRHLVGGAFVEVTSPTVAPLHGVWGTSASDVWVVGDAGTILHFDGTSWTPESSGLSGDLPNLLTIWGSGPDDVWIGGEGVLLHRTATNRRLP